MSLLRNLNIDHLNDRLHGHPSESSCLGHQTDLAQLGLAALKQMQSPFTPDDGFDRLEVRFGAFPRVTMDDGYLFRVNGHLLGNEFEAIIFSIRKAFLWMDRDPSEKSVARQAWSYDNKTTTRDENLPKLIAKWRAEGYEPYVRKYAEAIAEIQRLDGARRFVCLSVPPLSVMRLYAYREFLKYKYHSRVYEVITKISAGELINIGGNPLKPWTFEFLGEVEKAQ